MNRLIGTNYISVEGKENALKIAATLLEQDYQVFIQLDDSDIYVVAYTSNDTRYGGDEFAKLDDDEQEIIMGHRNDKENSNAIARVKGLLKCGFITKNELIHDDDDNVDSHE